MPELPEIEQVRKTLTPHILNKIIKRVEIRLPRMIKHPSPEAFADILVGQCIRDLKRKGKYLTFEFGTNIKLIAHLRMTGALIVTDSEDEEPEYAKIKFELTGDKTLWFCDIRTFGTLHLVINDDVRLPGFDNLGPEPGTKELNVPYLQEILKRRKASIKGIILDQEVVAGLGNIYADEILFASKINPKSYADRLTKPKLKEIIDNTK